MSASRRSFTLFLVVFLLVGSVAMPASSQSTLCAAKDLVPVLVDSTVNQGLPYTTLVRGKKAVVRFYLRRPACSAGTEQSIKIKTAVLTSTSGTTGLGAQINQPLDTLTSTESTKIPYVQPYVADPVLQKVDASNTSPSNPRFEIPASYLKPTTITGPFQATFTVTLTYDYDAKTNGTGSRTAVFSTAPASVAGPTASLRVLTVPMGNPLNGFQGDTQLTAGFGTLARGYPVPDGAGNVSDSQTGGILYVKTPGTMDIRTVMTSNGKLCSTRFNAPIIRALLITQLYQNNSSNDMKLTADRVLGAIDTASSLGDSSGCAEGMAGQGSKEAWTRTVTGATGAIMMMEESHNAGAVTPLRQSITDSAHSPNTEADAGTNRAYRLSDNAYLSNDATAMRWMGADVSSDAAVLLEKHDWEQVFCRLGGPVTADCAYPGAEGVVLGTGAGGTHPTQSVLVGLTDGTPEVVDDSSTWDPAAKGTLVFDGYFGPVPATTPPTSGSDYHFVQRSGSTILTDQLVDVSKVDSNHDHQGDRATVEPHSDLGFFSISYAHQPSADRWELWKGTPGSGTLLATRGKVASPTVSSLTTKPAPGQPQGAGFDEQEPLAEPAVPGASFSPGARVVADPRAPSLPNAVGNVTGAAGDGPLTISFDPPTFDVSMATGNGLPQTTATLQAFDSAGDPIVSETADVPVDEFGDIAVASPTGNIASVKLTYTRPAGLPAPGEEIDDLRFTPGAGPDISVVDSTATAAPGSDPRNLRGAFFAQCPITKAGQVVGTHNLPIASALRPTEIDGQTARFSITWDNGNSCEDGGRVALVFRASDGYSVSQFSPARSFSANENDPVPAILSPVIQGTILEHQQLTLAGQAYDATDGVLPGSQLAWYLSGPAYPNGAQPVGTGNSLTLPPPNGLATWPTGSYTVRLVATDFEGNSAEAVAPAVIEIDNDRDGISFNDEECYAGAGDEMPDNNPANAWGDADKDGYANVDDDATCVPATKYNVAADFDPDTLFVPSSGHPVTMYVKSSNRDLNQVIGSTVRISHIAGAPVGPGSSDPNAFDGAALSWQVQNGVGAAKFDRQKLTAWLSKHGLDNRFVTLRITGQGTSGLVTWNFFGQDTTNAKPGK